MKKSDGFAIVEVIVAIIILAILVGGAYTWYISNNGKVGQTDKQDTNQSGNSKPTESTESANLNDNQLDYNIQEEFQNSKFTIVRIIQNPFSFDYIYVVSDNAHSPETCGSIYEASPCYFFLQPRFGENGAISPQYLASYEKSLASVDDESSFKFIDINTLQFTTQGADAGYAVERTLNLDLNNKKIVEVSKKENSAFLPN